MASHSLRPSESSLRKVDEPKCMIEIDETGPDTVKESKTYSERQKSKENTGNSQESQQFKEDEIEKEKWDESQYIVFPHIAQVVMHLRKLLPIPLKGKREIIHEQFRSSDEKIFENETMEKVIIRNAPSVYIRNSFRETDEKQGTKIERYVIQILAGFILVFILTLSVILSITSSSVSLIFCGMVIYLILAFILFDWVKNKKRKFLNRRKSIVNLSTEPNHVCLPPCCPLQKPLFLYR